MRMARMDLRAEAAAESVRLTAARALSFDGDELARVRCLSNAPWIAVSRGCRLRGAIGHSALLVWQAAIADGTGRIVQSQLFGVAVALSTLGPSLRRRASVSRFLSAIERDVRQRLDASGRAWRDAAQDAVNAFAAARASRERAVAAFAEPADRFQAGLFDLRAQRHRSLQLAAAAEEARSAAERRAVLERAATLVHRPAELLLVLVP
jgi:hypothetical protein